MPRPKGGYELDGEPVPGSTTITGLLNKPALVGWAGKTMAEAARAHGRACFLAGEKGEDAPTFPKWGDVLYGQRDAAAIAGTCGHEASQAWVAGGDPETAMDGVEGVTDEARAGGREALASFKEYWTGRRLELVSMEEPLVSRRHRYGMTYDIVAKSSRGLEIVELKTGGTYAEHLLQMAAQAHALKECRDIEIVRHNCVRITRSLHPDVHEHSFTDLSEAWCAFLQLRSLYDLMKQVEARL